MIDFEFTEVLDSPAVLDLGKEVDLESVDLEKVDEPLFNNNDRSLESETESDITQEKDNISVRHIETRNSSLEGDIHPITGVSFERTEVVDQDGEKVSGVFPKFESIFDVILPNENLGDSDNKQFRECNKKLYEDYESGNLDCSKFSDRQLEQIKNGDKPEGFTWHHHEETGLMQLIDTETHDKTGHTGGKSVWGGGQDAR
ncbi:MAG: HNH endonuclease [Saccharospirillaceae bacterium]|nr:HNH endonuclease [Saccharospirillaceae bacterium]